MTPIYYIDGPCKGMTVLDDFRDINVGEVTYHKITFGSIVEYMGYKYRVFCDIAYCQDKPITLPPSAKENIEIDPPFRNCPSLPKDKIPELTILGKDGRFAPSH